MQWKLPFVLYTTMSSSNPTAKNTKEDNADVAVPVIIAPQQPEFKGIQVVEVTDKKTEAPAVAIQIRPIECAKSVLKWMKQYNVMQTLKDWASSIDWNAEVWTPLKLWSKEQDWDELKKEVKEGMDEVDWKQVRKDVKDEMKKVDWKEVRRDVKDSMKEVDWKEVRQQVREGMDQVDWKQVKSEVTDIADIVGVKDGVKELCPNSMKDEQGNVDWKQVKKSAKDLCPDNLVSGGLLSDDLNEAIQHAKDLCPEELECDQAWTLFFVEDDLKNDEENDV